MSFQYAAEYKNVLETDKSCKNRFAPLDRLHSSGSHHCHPCNYMQIAIYPCLYFVYTSQPGEEIL